MSLLTALVAAPILRLVAYRLGLVVRRPRTGDGNAQPIAHLGGAAICLGLLVGLAGTFVAMSDRAVWWGKICTAFSDGNLGLLARNPLWNMIAIAIAFVVITIVGLLSDLSKIGRKRQVAGQLLTATILLTGGVGLKMGNLLLYPLGISAGPWVVLALSVVMCFALVVLMSNTMRVMGDMDALCGGVTGIVSLAFLALTIWLAMWGRFPGTDELRIGLCLAMVGAVCGFLPYNIPPASIRLGHTGTMLLGLFVAIMMAMFCQEGNYRWVIASLGVFSVPLIDRAVSGVRHLRTGKTNLPSSQRSLHHQLLERGFTIREVVMLFYALSLFASIAAVLIAVYVHLRHAIPLYVVMVAGIVAMFYGLGLLKPSASGPGGAKAAATNSLNILFTSVGRRVSLLNEFRRAAEDLGIQLTISVADCSTLAPALEMADHRYIAPRVDSPEYIPGILEFCRKHSVDALVPLIDTELLVLSQAREQLAAVGTRLVLSSTKVIEISQDKALTCEFLENHGFRTPHILTPDELESASFPLFAKPRCGSAAIETHKINNAEEMAHYLGRRDDMIAQEFIEGAEYTVDVFADFDGKPRCAVPRLRLAVRGGEVSKGQVTEHPQIMETCCRVVEELEGCEGPLTLQCFLTPQNEIVVIELNARYGGGVPLSIHAGADSPRWLMELLMGRQPTIAMRGWTDGLLMLRYDKAIFIGPDGQVRQS